MASVASGAPGPFCPSVDVSLDALARNYRRFEEVGAGAAIAGVVKCDGYGLGAAATARTLAIEGGCRIFFVAYADEGAAARRVLEDVAPDAEIYVFHGPDPNSLPVLIAHGLKPVLNSRAQASLWRAAAPGSPAGVHIDTGMNRLGFPPSDFDGANPVDGLAIDLAMSHFACASTPDVSIPGAPSLARQAEDFARAGAQIGAPRRSLAASGAGLWSDVYACDVVRAGVALYGASPYGAPHRGLEPVARLTAPILQIRDCPAGATVGYDATHTLGRRSQLATVAIGYGDGVPRSGSDKLRVWANGETFPVVGRVSMDLIVVDVTAAATKLKPGDRVELFGPNLAIDDQARACGTIGYELLTGLGHRVARRYLWRAEPAPQSLLAASIV